MHAEDVVVDHRGQGEAVEHRVAPFPYLLAQLVSEAVLFFLFVRQKTRWVCYADLAIAWPSNNKEWAFNDKRVLLIVVIGFLGEESTQYTPAFRRIGMDDFCFGCGSEDINHSLNAFDPPTAIAGAVLRREKRPMHVTTSQRRRQ